VDFSDSCPGKADERKDIVGIRDDYSDILEVRVDAVFVTINPGGLTADVLAPCLFRARKNDGTLDPSQGDCVLTAVYEQRRWWLCSSNYENEVAIPAVGETFAIRRPKGRPAQPGTFAFHFR
jgi:hypothetical protein